MKIILYLVTLLCLVGSFALFAGAAGGPESASPAKVQFSSVQQRRLLAAIDREKAQLKKQAEALRARDLELKSLAAEVDKKLAQMKALRQQIDEALAAKSKAEQERVTALSRMYEKMDPTRAAQLMANLDEKLAIDILSGIKSKVGGQILENMDPQKAARLSVAFSKLGRH